MRSLGDAIAPRRLGRDFRWLLASSWTSNLGDGIALSAAPLLIASMTSSPVLVASGAMMQYLPWLFFGLLAGAVADRFDRRRLVMIANGLRALVVLGLVAFLVTGTANVWIVLGDRLPLRHRRGLRRLRREHAAADARASRPTSESAMRGCRRATWSPISSPGRRSALSCSRPGSFWPFLLEILCVTLALILISRITRTFVPAREVQAGCRPPADPRRPAVAAPQRAGANARADHPGLQRHVGGTLGRARALRDRVPRHRCGRLRCADDSVGARGFRRCSESSAGSNATCRSRR